MQHVVGVSAQASAAGRGGSTGAEVDARRGSRASSCESCVEETTHTAWEGRVRVNPSPVDTSYDSLSGVLPK